MPDEIISDIIRLIKEGGYTLESAHIRHLIETVYNIGLTDGHIAGVREMHKAFGGRK